MSLHLRPVPGSGRIHRTGDPFLEAHPLIAQARASVPGLIRARKRRVPTQAALFR
jgi:hypothetical protein